MFEKLKEYYEQGKSMLEDAFVEPEDDFVTVPEGVTEEQLIDEARQYVEAIIVKRPEGNKERSGESPSVFLKTGDADRKSYEVPDVPEQEPDDDTSDKETGKTDEPEEGEHEADQPKDEDAACRPENDMRPEAEADETVPPEPEDTDK